MSTYTRVSITRNKAPVNDPSGFPISGIPVQIDEASWDMAVKLNGEHPFDVFKIIVQYYPLLVFQRGDLLTDMVNIDVLTNALAAYRVTGNPRPFPDGHTELWANKQTGKQS